MAKRKRRGCYADPDEGRRKNEERADWAEQALDQFCLATRLSLRDDGYQCSVGDLIADLAHLCDRKGVDLAACIVSAEMHYNDETGGKGKQFE